MQTYGECLAEARYRARAWDEDAWEFLERAIEVATGGTAVGWSSGFDGTFALMRSGGGGFVMPRRG